MENNQISMILAVVLVVLILIFAIMLTIYLSILAKERRKKQQQKREEEARKQTENVTQTQQNQHGNVLDFMEFEDIQDNMIIQKERQKYVMVIECQGVNYDLMSAVEKTGVEEGFLQFLNTLRHPIQLYVQTRSINLEKSIEKYKQSLRDVELDYNRKKIAYQEMKKVKTIPDKQKQKAFFELTKAQNLYEYGKDIIRDTERLSLNKNILNKKYYIIIEYSYEKPTGDVEYDTEEIRNMAFSDLYTKAQSLIRTLGGTGVNGRILDTIDLAELLYMAYNRDGAESFGIERALKASYDMEVPANLEYNQKATQGYEVGYVQS